MIKSKTSTSVT